MRKEVLNTGREYMLVKEKLEVKEYLSQLFLHLAMLSLCKSPNFSFESEFTYSVTQAKSQVTLPLL